MLALSVKYRPKSFDDLTEQTSIKLILEEQVRTSTFKNGYLFVGGAGTGKTTSARILASMINKGKGSPIEVDAASNNGVDNVRSIIDSSKFKSLDSEFKVYILDEVHMFSTGAWNAMLKLLEEPPSKTIFIMCTTDPKKIPATILSRVQRYDFQRISFEGIVKRLKYIIEQENDYLHPKSTVKTYDITSEAVEYIAKIAEGGMRDAITLLDKCLSFNNNLTIKEVTEVLGTVNYIDMFKLTASIIAVDNKTIIEIIDNIHNRGIDLKQFIKHYYQFLVDIITHGLTGSYKNIRIPSTYKIEYSEEEKQTINNILKHILILYSDIKWEQNPRYLIEAKLLTLEVII